LSQQCFHKLINSIFNCNLNVSKFFIQLISQYFFKQQNIMIDKLIITNSLYYSICLFKHNLFQSIFLIKISAKKLLHGFSVLVNHVYALIIVFNFLNIYVGD